MATFTRISALLLFTLASTTTAEELADATATQPDDPVVGAYKENRIMNELKEGIAGTDQSTFVPTVDAPQVPGRHLQDDEHKIDVPRRKQKQEFAKMPKAAGKDPFEKNIILDTADDDMHRYAKKLSATSVQMSALYDSMNSQMKTYKDSLIVLVHAAKELMRNMRKTLNEEANAVDLENHARMLPIDSLDDLVLHHVQNYAWKKKGDYQQDSIQAVENATNKMHNVTTTTSQSNMVKHKNDQIVQAAKSTEWATTLQTKEKDDLNENHAEETLESEELANQVKGLLKHETTHRLEIAVQADQDAEYEKQRAAYLETVITAGTARLEEKKARQVEERTLRDADSEVKKKNDDIKTTDNELAVAKTELSHLTAQKAHHDAQKTVGESAGGSAQHVVESQKQSDRYAALMAVADTKVKDLETAKTAKATELTALDKAKADQDAKMTTQKKTDEDAEGERQTKLQDAEKLLATARNADKESKKAACLLQHPNDASICR